MSILKVNELRPQSGSNVSIQSGYTLRLGSKNLDSSSVMPSPSGQNGKILVSKVHLVTGKIMVLCLCLYGHLMVHGQDLVE